MKTDSTGLNSRDKVLLLAWLPGVVAFALSLGPLSWDGAYYVFRTVHEGAPPVFHDRIPAALLSVPAWVAQSLTEDLSLTRLIFSITYAAVPLAIMGLTYFLVRRENSHLLMWSAVGITAMMLPLQFFAVSEAMIATQLAWPLLAIALGAPTRLRYVLGAVLAVAITFLHPVTACFLGTLLLIVALRWRRTGERQRFWSALFAVCLTVSIFMPRSGYENSMSAGERIGNAFGTAWGSPPLVLFAVLIAGLSFYGFGSHATQKRVQSWVVAALAIFVVGNVWWSSTAVSWTELLDYRFLIPLFSCPLLIAAAFSTWRAENTTVAFRRVMVGLCGVGFSAVLIIQSLAWHSGLERFDEAVASQDTQCIDSGAVASDEGAVYRFWTLTPLSVVMGDRQITSVVISDNDCEWWKTSGELRLTPDPDPVGKGWFRY